MTAIRRIAKICLCLAGGCLVAAVAASFGLFGLADHGEFDLGPMGRVKSPGLVLGVAAAIFFGVWIALGVVRRRRMAGDAWLMRHGRIVSTDYQAVRVSALSDGEGSSSYEIVSRWRDRSSGMYHTFVSRPIAFDPEPYAVGRGIAVRVDPADPRHYLMDTTFLPSGDEIGEVAGQET